MAVAYDYKTSEQILSGKELLDLSRAKTREIMHKAK
jgi:hypothetical protein